MQHVGADSDVVHEHMLLICMASAALPLLAPGPGAVTPAPQAESFPQTQTLGTAMHRDNNTQIERQLLAD